MSNEELVNIKSGVSKTFIIGGISVVISFLIGVIDVYLPHQYYVVGNTAPKRVDHWIDTSFSSNSMAKSYNLNNTLLTSIIGTKTWISGTHNHVNNDELSFSLKRRVNNENFEDYNFDIANNITWDGNKYTISNLAKYDTNGNLYEYQLSENEVAGYTITQSGNNFTNTITGEIEITGTKTWVDNKTHNNSEDVVLKLYRESSHTTQEIVTK